MRLFLAAAAFSITAACGPNTPAPDSLAAVKEISAPAADTNVIAVLSYASWCGSCKALDPKVEAVRAANTFEGVEFFALDYSAKDSDAYYAAASMLGVADTMKAEFGDTIKTGKMYLIDRSSGEVISLIDKSMDETAITQAIKDAAALT